MSKISIISLFSYFFLSLQLNSYSQPLGGSGRVIVPGTHISLTDSSGGFTPAYGATWIADSGWRLIANQDAVRTPVFDLQHLSSGNLQWYARVYSPSTLSTYVTFVEWYGTSPSAESGNTYFVPVLLETTYNGTFEDPADYSSFALDFSKSWYPLDPLEPDNQELYITEFWIEVDELALSVSFLSFDALKSKENALLNWTTASEETNKGFEVERSLDGKRWITIGFVNSLADNGNSNYKLDYSFTDNQPVSGNNYYRLKQVDFDGKYEYSPVRTVWFDNVNSISIYPNPAKESIAISGLQGDESIKVYDATGRIVCQQKADKTSVFIPFEKTIRGVYCISIISKDGAVSSHKIVKD